MMRSLQGAAFSACSGYFVFYVSCLQIHVAAASEPQRVSSSCDKLRRMAQTKSALRVEHSRVKQGIQARRSLPCVSVYFLQQRPGGPPINNKHPTYTVGPNKMQTTFAQRTELPNSVRRREGITRCTNTGWGSERCTKGPSIMES